MSAKNVADATGAIKGMANGQQTGLGQSRNQNPLAYNFNGQPGHPATFNHFAVGSKGLVGAFGGLGGAGRQGHQSGQTMAQQNYSNFDSNSLDRVHQPQQTQYHHQQQNSSQFNHQQNNLLAGGVRPASNNKRRQLNHNPNMRQSVVLGGTSQNVYRDQQNQDVQSSTNLHNKTATKSFQQPSQGQTGQLKVNKRTASMKEGSVNNGANYQSAQGPQLKMTNLNARQPRKQQASPGGAGAVNAAAGSGGQIINAGSSFIYENNLYQSRHNTQESNESSKSRNGGLNDHFNQNSSLYQQINILTGPTNVNKTQGQHQPGMKIDLSNNNNNRASAATVGLAGSNPQQQSHQQLQQKRKQQSFIDKYNQHHQLNVQANSRNNQLVVASGPENHTVGALPRGTSSSKSKHQTHLSNNDLIMQNMQNNGHLISQIKHQPTGSVVVQPAGPGVEQQFSSSQLEQPVQQPTRNMSQGLGGGGMAQQQFKSDFPQHGK